MSASHDDKGRGALAATRVARVSLVLENVGVAAAFLACAIGFSLVLSQPLAAVANEDGVEPVMLVSVHW